MFVYRVDWKQCKSTCFERARLSYNNTILYYIVCPCSGCLINCLPYLCCTVLRHYNIMRLVTQGCKLHCRSVCKTVLRHCCLSKHFRLWFSCSKSPSPVQIAFHPHWDLNITSIKPFTQLIGHDIYRSAWPSSWWWRVANRFGPQISCRSRYFPPIVESASTAGRGDGLCLHCNTVPLVLHMSIFHKRQHRNALLIFWKVYCTYGHTS